MQPGRQGGDRNCVVTLTIKSFEKLIKKKKGSIEKDPWADCSSRTCARADCSSGQCARKYRSISAVTSIIETRLNPPYASLTFQWIQCLVLGVSLVQFLTLFMDPGLHPYQLYGRYVY